MCKWAMLDLSQKKNINVANPRQRTGERKNIDRLYCGLALYIGLFRIIEVLPQWDALPLTAIGRDLCAKATFFHIWVYWFVSIGWAACPLGICIFHILLTVPARATSSAPAPFFTKKTGKNNKMNFPLGSITGLWSSNLSSQCPDKPKKSHSEDKYEDLDELVAAMRLLQHVLS